MPTNRKDNSFQESSEFAAVTRRFEAVLLELEGKDRRTANLQELQRDGERLADAFKAFEERLGIIVAHEITARGFSGILWKTGLSNNLEANQVELANGLRGRFAVCRQELAEERKGCFPSVCQQFEAILEKLERKDHHTAGLEELQRDRERLADAFKAFEERLGLVVGYDITVRSFQRSLWNQGVPKHLEPNQAELANDLKTRVDIHRQQLTEEGKAQFPVVCEQFETILAELEQKDRSTGSLEDLKMDNERLAEAFAAFENALGLVVGYDRTARHFSNALWQYGLPNNLQPDRVELANFLRDRFRTLKRESKTSLPISSYRTASPPVSGPDERVRPHLGRP
jgi:hypothetical protein